MLERRAGRKLHGEFTRLHRFLETVLQPLTAAAVDRLGDFDALLALGQQRAATHSIEEELDDVAMYALALVGQYAPELQELVRTQRGRSTLLKRVLERAMEKAVINFQRPLLEFDDLINGLEAFGDKYRALDVFADDVHEIVESVPVAGLKQVDGEGRKFLLSPPARSSSYELELFPEQGVLRISQLPMRTSNAGAGAALGALAGAAMGVAASKKGEATTTGLLGLLVGADGDHLTIRDRR